MENNFRVNYSINVNASEGAKGLTTFAESVQKLANSKESLAGVTTTINNMLAVIDKAFGNHGHGDKGYKISVDIGDTLTDLGKVESKLQTIVNTIKELNGIHATTKNANPLSDEVAKQAEGNSKKIKESAKDAVAGVMTPIEKLHASITGINTAMIALSNERAVKIDIKEAEEKLSKLLGLAREVKGSLNMTAGTNMASPPLMGAASMHGIGYVVPASIIKKRVNGISDNDILKQADKEQEAEHRANIRRRLDSFKSSGAEGVRSEALYGRARELTESSQIRNEAEREKNEARANRMAEIRAGRESRNAEKMSGKSYGSAVNRLQYLNMPSVRSLPFVEMISAYTGYSILKSQISSVMEYQDTMASVQQVLKSADKDMGTFDERFGKLANHVRQIGVETKFTTNDMARATRTLAMAGLDMQTITSSMRPIANMALIEGTDIEQVAEYTSNILRAYNISEKSVGTMSDVLTSTSVGTNAELSGLGEAFKMSAGYLKLAGVKFEESAAAIGVLGNSGMKGTMAGTAMRAMITRFTKPTAEAEKVIDRLKVKFFEFTDEGGKKVEKLRPLVNIFKDLKDKGASLEDMIAVFGKVGGNAAMNLLQNYDKLAEQTQANRMSNGVAASFGKMKQNTTKGLWDQVTSQFSESFTEAFEKMEPRIRSVLRMFIEKFDSQQFTDGLIKLGHTLLDLFTSLAKVGAWVVSNLSWLEPMLLSGFAAIRIVKFVGVLADLKTVLGGLAKTSEVAGAALKSSGLIASLTGKVNIGGGLLGAMSSLGLAGAATIGILGGVATYLGYVKWQMWQVDSAKKALQEDINSNRKYHYPSIESLYSILNKTKREAVAAKAAKDMLTGTTVEDLNGGQIGTESSTNGRNASDGFGWGTFLFGKDETLLEKGIRKVIGKPRSKYTLKDAYQDDINGSADMQWQKDKDKFTQRAVDYFGQYASNPTVFAAMTSDANIKKLFGINSGENIDKSLYSDSKRGKYREGLNKLDGGVLKNTTHYKNRQNKDGIENIKSWRNNVLAQYGQAGGSNLVRSEYIKGFHKDKNGRYVEDALPKNASADQIANHHIDVDSSKEYFKSLAGNLSKYGSGAASMIMDKAGIPKKLYENSVEYNPESPNPVTTPGGADDKGAGGNYSGTGKLSSAAPKQVVVNINNLLSVQTIKLMRTKEGKTEEMQDLKGQLTELLLNVVHDFDASWNG